MQREHPLNDQPEIVAIRQFLAQYPRAKIVTEALPRFRRYPDADEAPSTARIMNGEIYYDAFNSSIQIDTSLNIQVYHKAKLVPGVNSRPTCGTCPFMKKLALDMGGISRTVRRPYARSTAASSTPVSNAIFSTAICYESVYGDFVAEKVRQGANLLVICTNDGWWGNTEGHRQHLQYARLRATETRRWVACSANTGISAFITPRGEVIDPQPYWEPAVIAHAATPLLPSDVLRKYSG